MNLLWSLLERASRQFPDGLAITAGSRVGGALTWSEVEGRARAQARCLAARGLQPGSTVACLADNGPGVLISSFATARLGAILVPLNPRLSLPEQRAIVDLAGCGLGLADHLHWERASELLGEGRVLSLEPEERLEAGARNAPPASVDPRTPSPAAVEPGSAETCSQEPAAVEAAAPAQLYFTSGTTGDPKGVVLTHANIHAHALAAVEALGLTAQDTWGHFAPMFHLADAWATFAITAVGGTHSFLPRFDAARCLEVCQRDGVTLTNLVPTMLQRVLATVEDGADPPRSLRLCLSGGAPIAPAVVERVLSALGCAYRQTYGLTETSPYLTLSQLEQHEEQLPLAERAQRLARTGTPFPTVELRVVDPEGKSVPPDDASVGEIVVRGPTISPGYWQNEEATAAAHRGGWFHTGDLATVDAGGSVLIVDRLKDLILSGGENVYSIEVEAALLAHPAVLECAVFGLPHSDLGECVSAAVVPRSGRALEAEELRDHCRERIAGYKLPRRLWLVEELPRTGSGKIRKRTLREQAAAGVLGVEA